VGGPGAPVGGGDDAARRGSLFGRVGFQPAAGNAGSGFRRLRRSRGAASGRNVYLECQGEGSPTVVLEAGGGLTADL
jgi:hypothetical protein